jgi:hypothetical protein
MQDIARGADRRNDLFPAKSDGVTGVAGVVS